MLLYRILSRLLDYPDQELTAHLGEIRDLLRKEPRLGPAERRAVEALLDWMEAQHLTELQAAYVDTFDLKQEHSLYLTHHIFGDDRERGPALVELSEHYKGAGLAAEEGGELPDYLPLVLEYISTLDDDQASGFLGQAAHVLAGIAAALEAAGSPYAPLLRIVERRGACPGRRQAANNEQRGSVVP